MQRSAWTDPQGDRDGHALRVVDGATSSRRGEGGPYCQPVAGRLLVLLQVCVVLKERQVESRIEPVPLRTCCASVGIRPLGGTTTIAVGRPVGFADVNTALYAPATSW